MMSALYLRGLKQGDMQMTAAGIITAALFYFLSQAKPLPAISALQPPSSVFALSVMSSVAGQFIVHLISLMITLKLCEQYI
jgi:cation-transporting ATPase 13A1